jgi:hypothetical protein
LIPFQICPKVSHCLQCPRKWDIPSKSGVIRTRSKIKVNMAYPLLDKTRMPSCSWPISQIWPQSVGSTPISTWTTLLNLHPLSHLFLSPVPSKTSKRCP